MVRVTSLLIDAESPLWFSFVVRPWTEMKIWCVKYVYAKSSLETINSGFKFKLTLSHLNSIHFQTTFSIICMPLMHHIFIC